MTKDIILVLVVVAGLISFFYNPTNVDMKYLQIIMGGIIGFYTGIKEIPLQKSVTSFFKK